MPRTPPSIPIPELKDPESKTWELTLQTITPMFGGSAVTREVDRDHPVRAASVRGHLRFWWRATAGAGFETVTKLFEAEEAIWGSVEKYGGVRVEVLSQNADTPRIPNLSGQLNYAIFPFQKQRGSWDKPEVAAAQATSAEFTLRLTCPPKYLPQVQTAVKAWVMFGGIGSRTRRGCGSLKAEGLDSSLTAPGSSPTLLTTLPGAFYQGKVQGDPLWAWSEAASVYKEFRQQRNAGQERNRPGRSHWPEPDSLRRMTGRAAPDHVPSHAVNGFPRADLGLPIIFHFKDKGDPSDQTLQGTAKGQERFASPIITKALAVTGGYVAVVMILDAPHVWEGEGIGFRQGEKLGREQIELSPSDRKERPLNGKPIREALADFVQQNGFGKVSL